MPARQDASSGNPVAMRGTDGLVEAALAAERDCARQRAEFAWLVGHPAIGPVADGHAGDGDAARLGVGNIAAQHAARFPVVSGDADWLRHRSVAVVARRLAPLLAAGAEVGLDLSVLARGDGPAGERREQMRLVATGLGAGLPGALRPFGVEARGLTLSAGAEHPGLGELLALRGSAALGWPRIVVRLPDRLMTALQGTQVAEPRGAGAEALRLWHGLTGLAHREAAVRLVLQRTTRPACSLAGAEPVDAVLPVGLFEARAETAWLAVRLRLDALGAADPDAALVELRRLLAAVLRLADNLVDHLDWPTPELAQDALVNRRLALHVTGIGSLVDRWGRDPADFATVAVVVRWLGVVRRLVLRESNLLARERGPFPGLELRELARTLASSVGEERARRLLRQAGLRHRHLLVMSPWDVFPATGARRPLPEYLHLLPAIRWADTIAMYGDGIRRALPVAAFRRLLRLTAAIAHNRP